MALISTKLTTGKIYVHELGAYHTKDPNVYHKVDYNPFGWGSLTWLVWKFKRVTPRGRIRKYESFGRTEEEALKGLERATKKTGFVTIKQNRK